MACNTNSLSMKTVINICDARTLGHIVNYEIDLCDGRILAVFVPGDCSFVGFSRAEDIRIPWDCIKKIGEDAVLVDIPPRPCDTFHQKEKRRFFK